MNSTTVPLHNLTIGQIAAQTPVSIRVFESWKIDYCCGGSESLADACARSGRTVEDFMHAMEAAAVVPENASRDWSCDSLRQISSRIVDTYHRYTREELDTLTPIAAKVLGVHGERRPELAEVIVLVKELTADLLPHMLKEEQILFPFVEQLELAAENGSPAPTPFFGTVKNPVRMMMIEHDRVGDLLSRLRVVTENYTPPSTACFSYRELYRRLAEFELRTHEHIHIENNVFFPRAVALEERVGNPAEFAAAHSCGTSSCA
jgi:regulator of cell morphogenesis and NO signaling